MGQPMPEAAGKSRMDGTNEQESVSDLVDGEWLARNRTSSLTCSMANPSSAKVDYNNMYGLSALLPAKVYRSCAYPERTWCRSDPPKVSGLSKPHVYNLQFKLYLELSEPHVDICLGKWLPTRLILAQHCGPAHGGGNDTQS
ncbi:hypothetical protein PSTG_18743 [Puccinia striiformis f. sp. tritici PST-78]|uniref:Uncharacterized protein n=1 Tax=Puccinia striiformis f. sp. tritici PST-78 TaxID=1165861 RepID=A0A0L0ULK6_9BASI|nr:hypothetical protein PSTG_18743 [Puccinia striiformis f. sp. tritici PST-78]